MAKRVYSVYILANPRHTVFYVGVTSNLVHRVLQHKAKLNKGFTLRYNVINLMYYEEFYDIRDAIHREKQVKRYRRKWKENLINEMNPEWKDLSEGLCGNREFEMFTR